jgi:hypothetical protein
MDKEKFVQRVLCMVKRETCGCSPSEAEEVLTAALQEVKDERQKIKEKKNAE